MIKQSDVINIIKYVKTSGKSYSGIKQDIGYHSIELDNTYYKDQRDCIKRIEYIVKRNRFYTFGNLKCQFSPEK
jgi:hypothetical protein